MAFLQHAVLGVDDIDRAARFWCGLLDYQERPGFSSPRWRTLEPAGGGEPSLALMASDTPADSHPRTHLDIGVHGEQQQRSMVERTVRLGGRQVDWHDWPEDPDFVVCEDTEGNRFCLVDVDHGRG